MTTLLAAHRSPRRRVDRLASQHIAKRTLWVLAAFVGLAYVTWRLLVTVDLSAWWVSVPLWALEAHAALSFGVFLFTAWDVSALRPAQPVWATSATVAVLIPTYNESMEVLLPTLAAAVAMDVEHATWVLDDGNRLWVKELADSLGVSYLARATHEHAKAGNINNALQVLDADFIAILDADHVAHPQFLVRTLAYFDDERVALVQTPQDFYNLDSFEHVRPLRPGGKLHCEQSVFYRVLQPARNRWNAAFWCGTSAVLRRVALDEIGGLATSSITEDIQTTIRLHRAGWRTAYHNEVLARGLAAADGTQYLSQRLRWGTGAMQVLRQERPITGPSLTLAQRACYAATLLGWFDAWRTLAYLLLPSLVLITGASPINAALPMFATIFIPTLFIQQAALLSMSRGQSSLRGALLFEFVRMPSNVAATLTLFTRRQITFRVTDKGRTGEGRNRIGVPGLHAIVLLVSASALTWFGFTITGHTGLHYRVPWAINASAGWLLFNVGLLVYAIKRIRSVDHATERRTAFRFPATGTVLLAHLPAQLLDVSLTGLRASCPAEAVVDSEVMVTFTVADGTVSLPALRQAERLNGARTIHTLEFLPGWDKQKAKLALWLFAPISGTNSVTRPRVASSLSGPPQR